MHSSSRIPSSVERRAVSKKKDDIVRLGDVVGSIRAAIVRAEGYGERGAEQPGEWTCPLMGKRE